ncbi:MAG: iron-containing alcohol dehydrogenase [Casimicrobiaceae bacterium]
MGIDTFGFPTTIRFGSGAACEVAPHLRERGFARPLVVTDRALAQLPVAQAFIATLRDAGLEVAVYDGVFGNPTGAQAMAGGAAARAHRADTIVGFGGGAALDVAKAVLVVAVHDGDVLEYAWDHPRVRPLTRDLPYFVAVPTTAGTGSEVGRSAVVSDDATHVKKILFSQQLLAKIVFADPDLTLDLPPAITAATGMDALTHNIESYLSPAYHPLCDGIALEGVRIGARSLASAVRHGHDRAARADMLMTSMMGAIAFQKDLGAVHSCAHALSTVADLHHGLANGVMIDHVMAFNLPAAVDKMAELAHVAAAPGATSGTPEARASAFIEWLRALKREIGIPAALSAVRGTRNVTRDDVPALVAIAVDDICHRTNPRPCSAADFTALFTAAL